VIVRVLSWLSIACIVTAIALVVFYDGNETPAVAVLLLAGFGITILLGLRAGYHKARGIVSDARAFVSGDIQHARLVSVGDPNGIFWPASKVELQLQGEDGNVHSLQRDVPVPFPVAWSYRLGKRFNLPLMRSTDLTKLMAVELKREGMDVTVGRG